MAAAAATCGELIDVPESDALPLKGKVDTMLVPGAQTSSPALLFVSTATVLFFCVLPTETTLLKQPGALMKILSLALPAAATETTPSSRNAWTAFAMFTSD